MRAIPSHSLEVVKVTLEPKGKDCANECLVLWSTLYCDFFINENIFLYKRNGLW
jgi:hypothetical protein